MNQILLCMLSKAQSVSHPVGYTAIVYRYLVPSGWSQK